MSVVHIADLFLSLGDSHPPTGWPTASWAIDRQGIAHSHYKHSHAGSHFQNQMLSQLRAAPICNDVECGDAKHFGPDVAALLPPGVGSAGVVASALRHLNARSSEDPRTSLHQLRLLQERLTQDPYQDWASTTTVAADTQSLILRTKDAVRADEAHDVKEAATRVLQNVGEGPLQELLDLLNTYVVDEIALHSVARAHALACDASPDWSARMQQLVGRVLEHSAPEGHMLPTYLEPVLETERLRGVPKWEAKHRVWAAELTRVVSQLAPWWSQAHQQLTGSPMRALVYLPADRVQFDTSMPWESWRPSRDTPLLHAPYAVGRLAEMDYSAPCLILGDRLTRAELDACSVLVKEQSENVSSETLAGTMTAARFLCK